MKLNRRAHRRRLVAIALFAAVWMAAGWLARDLFSSRNGRRAHYGDRESDTLILHPRFPGSGETSRPSGGDYPTPATPWIAVIIDDFGQSASWRIAPEFFALPFPVTISVIPGNPRSAAIAKLAAAAGCEVFVHLPMEPERRQSMQERDMVLTGMSAAEIRRILDRALTEIPNAAGVNNHMGSKATADSNLMKLLAAEIRRRDLKFVDSRTGYQSCAYGVMETEGVSALWRDIFLDNDRDTAVVARQIQALEEVARTRGWALGIGHCVPGTLEILARMMPHLISGGVRVVAAGNLIDKASAFRRETMAHR